MSPLRIALIGSAAAFAMSLGAAFAANADTAAPASVEKRIIILDDGKGDHREMHWERSGDERHGDHMGEHMAEHLRAVLQLTPTQEPALEAFLTSMKPPAPMHGPGDGERRIEVRHDHDASPADMAKMKDDMAKAHADVAKAHEDMEKHRAEMAAITTPQKLDLMVKRMNEHMAEATSRMQQHVDAVKRFYGALTPSQQKAFDALQEGGMMGGMHEGGFGEDGGEGWDGGPRMERHERMGMMPPLPPLPPLPPMAMMAPPAPPAPPPPPPPPPPPAF